MQCILSCGLVDPILTNMLFIRVPGRKRTLRRKFSLVLDKGCDERTRPNTLFMCQDENENIPEDESFRLFWIDLVTNEPGPQDYDTLKDGLFVLHKFLNEPKLWFSSSF